MMLLTGSRFSLSHFSSRRCLVQKVKTMSTKPALDLDSRIPILRSLPELREWRLRAFKDDKSVGLVPTMGALHEGHLSLVRRSLADNELTVVSIFVNPTQFAPHEDLASYPRTLPQDLEALSQLSIASHTTSAIFLPTVETMYPQYPGFPPENSLLQGTFVEVTSLGSVMEGASRPSFFRGVATVVTKLFNAVQPTRAYFGQKDIQQALLLRRMVSDLLMPNPRPEEVHVVPTARSLLPEDDGLALSSRNAYLSPTERRFAPTLYRALRAGEFAWSSGRSKDQAIHAALKAVEEAKKAAEEAKVDMRLDYVQINDSATLNVVNDQETRTSQGQDSVQVLSGALWVGRTRLIDNILLGDASKIIY